MSVWLPARALSELGGAWSPLEADAADHARVLRLSDRDAVTLFDGVGRCASAALESRDGRVGVRVVGEVVRTPQPHFTLVQAMPKGDKLDDIVRMATEIGVRGIELALSERCVARPSGERADKQVARLSRLAWAAAAQAEQAWVPDVVSPSALGVVAARAPLHAVRIVAAPRSRGPMPALDVGTLGVSTWLVVGPEGGLSPAEEAALEHSGWQPLTLATGILRTETAAAVLFGALLGRGYEPPNDGRRADP